jgi:hypothetical protein
VNGLQSDGLIIGKVENLAPASTSPTSRQPTPIVLGIDPDIIAEAVGKAAPFHEAWKAMRQWLRDNGVIVSQGSWGWVMMDARPGHQGQRFDTNEYATLTEALPIALDHVKRHLQATAGSAGDDL